MGRRREERGGGERREEQRDAVCFVRAAVEYQEDQIKSVYLSVKCVLTGSNQ